MDVDVDVDTVVDVDVDVDVDTVVDVDVDVDVDMVVDVDVDVNVVVDVDVEMVSDVDVNDMSSPCEMNKTKEYTKNSAFHLKFQKSSRYCY